MVTPSLELKQLRYLTTIIDAGTFTDAALELGVSQAAVSRTLAKLESELGVRLLHRTSRSIMPTEAGLRVVARARLILSNADDLLREAKEGRALIRIGHPWSAFGEHTSEFQRRWHTMYREIQMQLTRHNTASGGLAEGLCDMAVIRTVPDPSQWASCIVGLENRVVAMASDDPWARRRHIKLREIPSRTVSIDRRTGSTTLELWKGIQPPTLEHTNDVDDWLSSIGAGDCIGITPESTAAQYRRAGIVHRPLTEAEPAKVYLIWRPDNVHPATEKVIALAQELYGKHASTPGVPRG